MCEKQMDQQGLQLRLWVEREEARAGAKSRSASLKLARGIPSSERREGDAMAVRDGRLWSY